MCVCVCVCVCDCTRMFGIWPPRRCVINLNDAAVLRQRKHSLLGNKDTHTHGTGHTHTSLQLGSCPPEVGSNKLKVGLSGMLGGRAKEVKLHV